MVRDGGYWLPEAGNCICLFPVVPTCQLRLVFVVACLVACGMPQADATAVSGRVTTLPPSAAFVDSAAFLCPRLHGSSLPLAVPVGRRIKSGFEGCTEDGDGPILPAPAAAPKPSTHPAVSDPPVLACLGPARPWRIADVHPVSVAAGSSRREWAAATAV